MKRNLATPALFLVLAFIPSEGFAQNHRHLQLHVNPRWKECSFQLDPSLTQSAWRRFTGEAGVVTFFRPLSDAKPMGRGRFEVSVLQWETQIDDHSNAWNDTFVHPDSTHWLTDGHGLAFPGLTVRAGVSSKVDAGAYFTRNPDANYGFYGGQVQYSMVDDEESNWAAAARVSLVSLYGPDDLDFTVYGMEVVTSREYALFSNRASVSPYMGVSTYLANSHEKTAAVALDDERVLGAQATVGAVAKVGWLRVAAEYNAAKVSSRSIKLGLSF